MPIDGMMLNPMLDPFRTMQKEIESKGITGPDYDEMKAAMDRMEQLGQEKDDLNEFNAVLMNENLFGKFSDAYGRCLSGGGSSGGGDSADGYDDNALLQQALDALRSAVQQIRDSKQQAIDTTNNYDAGAATQQQLEYASKYADQYGIDMSAVDQQQVVEDVKKDQAENPEKFSNAAEIEVLIDDAGITEPIEALIKLGEEPGMSYPNFLRIQIEQGLDKAMDGSVQTLKGLEYSLGWEKASATSPYHVECLEKQIEKYKELSSAAAFGVPDSLVAQLTMNEIERDFEPSKIQFDKTIGLWERILDQLDTWIVNHTKYAHFIDPYKMIMDQGRRQAAIDKDRECAPGIMKEWEKLLQRYFGLSFHDIFSHETFLHEVKTYHFDYSQEYIEFLIKKIYPICEPFASASQELIDQCGQLFTDKKMLNPEVHRCVETVRDFYDATFGEGLYTKKYGEIEKNDSQAAPWDLATFSV